MIIRNCIPLLIMFAEYHPKCCWCCINGSTIGISGDRDLIIVLSPAFF
ncbi:hypothetical protein D1AOALGA4SA_11099 [Olavius algarvensis Delta 1 endosymbiont]|nr:hypothetical protein D1AOALGA4SA_11099 [Olavius algarvensis Delta 1 endosymbiont]